MCWCAELMRACRLRARWVSCLGFLWLCACVSEHPCSTERCDGQDNDCDGLIDEDYTSDDGLYLDPENCGTCGVRCAEVLPSAQRSECVRVGAAAQCAIVECPPERSTAIDGACVAAVSVGCLPCTTDDECGLRERYARCLPDASGSKRCFPLCGADERCPDGFACTDVASARLCVPRSGACECGSEMQGAVFACELKSPDLRRSCPGRRECGEAGLRECTAALDEACNHEDDDCDGLIDEGFTDEAGRYVSREHCGACGAACTAQGPHMLASCEVTFNGARCAYGCESGFVDRDGFANNGCECQLGSTRVPVINGDQDCDGDIDAVPPLVFVSPGGDDANAGTEPSAAVSSITRGMQLGAMLGRSVVVARGVYRERLDLLAGVTLVGGYSPDFTAHDAELYPVWIEAPASDPGLPVLRCDAIARATYVAHLTIIGSDARDPGQGSTSVLLTGCTDAVELHGITVIAGRGANGQRGEDSSARSKLAELAGAAGGLGNDSMIEGCAFLTGGAAGRKSCGDFDVSGGEGGAARCAALSCSNAAGTPCGNAGCSDFTTDGVCDIEAARAVAQSNPAAEPGRGNTPGRAGVPTYDAPTNHGACSFCDDNPSLPRAGGDGGDGRPGDAGGAGEGCAATPLMDARGLVQGAAGGDGGDGQPGSGGGGGSAGAGYAVIAATSGSCSSVPGAAGGGGGSAGCGAPGAAGGGGGGASIGIAIRLPAGSGMGPLLEDVRVVTASGGDAGDGGIGAAGGAGGSGGRGGVSTFWCARNGGRGGDGGAGGDAGGGGGGCGGSSFGILVAYDDAAVPESYAASLRPGDAVRVDIAGNAGRGGRGGFSPSHPGSAGTTGQVSDLAFKKL